eukprot:3373281-Rhodomonas_salina.1
MGPGVVEEGALYSALETLCRELGPRGFYAGSYVLDTVLCVLTYHTAMPLGTVLRSARYWERGCYGARERARHVNGWPEASARQGAGAVNPAKSMAKQPNHSPNNPINRKTTESIAKQLPAGTVWPEISGVCV